MPSRAETVRSAKSRACMRSGSSSRGALAAGARRPCSRWRSFYRYNPDVRSLGRWCHHHPDHLI